MGSNARFKNIDDINRIVVKIGTSTLTYPGGKLNFHRIDQVARVLSDLNNQGRQIVFVTSAAIGVGIARLGKPELLASVPGKQAAASVGQAMLMKIYQRMFNDYNQIVSQVLLTKYVTDTERTRVNAQNTMNTLLEMNVIPIVNENDTIATEEIVFGDNDTLSATVAALIDADLLILLSDIDGLYTGNPKANPDAKLISRVDDITEDIENLASGKGSTLGTGGMITKIKAASIAYEHGIDTIIANGDNPEILYDILEGKTVGTHFVAPSNR